MEPRILPPHRLDLAGHRRRNGVVPWVAYHGDDGRDRLIAAVEAAGLRGGGSPTATKLRAARATHSIVVATGCEGDPLSRKDVALLALSPHHVLDGLQLAAHAIGAAEAVLRVHVGGPALPSVTAALGERDDRVPVRVVAVPRRDVTGETAFVRGRPALVSDVETLAQLASVVLLGPHHYRASRTELVTVTGAVRRPGVVEVAAGTSLAGVLDAAGGEAEPVQAVLAGGTWTADLGAGRPGIAAVHALPARDCGLEYTARMLAFLAADPARQSGPGMAGPPSIVADFAEPACRLPLPPGHGAARLVASALRVFDADVRAHRAGGRCRVPAGVA
ncbi:SLBB domain-containing protein [Amycolatopsis sp. MtRt-6]|uniref:SLBB domain-containing protein n=1 Tax=Amycolatopsis sp. MtRt-6 TaxID=2792782 RepID=UPI001A906FBE|nr:SLBB domain-containing protein [Amycolatopsis sp. MtRt-6]